VHGKSMTIEHILTLLAAAPHRITTLTGDLAPAQLRIAPASDEWSVSDVLAHLRACADVWGGYIARILTEDVPAIRYLSPRTWIRRTDYPEQEFQSSLQAFITQRIELLAVLEPLPLDAWSRTARVTKSGSVQEQTVRSLAEQLATHEQPHLEQIELIVSPA